jgi:hypothetical protein
MKTSNGRRVLVLGAGVEHDVVDGHVHGVLHQRRLDLVGAADQDLRALDALVHLDDVVDGLRGGGGLRLLRGIGARGFLGLVLCGDDGVALDFLVDPDGHLRSGSSAVLLYWGGSTTRPATRAGRAWCLLLLRRLLGGGLLGRRLLGRGLLHRRLLGGGLLGRCLLGDLQNLP